MNCPRPPGADARGAARLTVARLALTDFRCYRSLRLEIDARPVVLFGPNGAGKTNLLEAVSLLAPGRGLRRARLADIERRGAAAPWAVAATVETPRGPVAIGTGRDPRSGPGGPAGGDGDGDGDGGGGGGAPPGQAGAVFGSPARGPARRVVKIDGARASGPAALSEIVHAVWLTPAMDRLFDGPGSVRRRFLDRVVYGLDPGHARRVSAYQRALRERARLLRSGARDRAWLEALEHGMAADGVAIAAARSQVGARLRAACAEGFGPFPGADLEVAGTVEGWLAAMPAVEAEDRLRARLAATRAQDAGTGGAAEGPHKSELRVRHGGNGMAAAQCSSGEQKALVVAIVLASAAVVAAARGAAPLILLDEVAAHLDPPRCRALFERIAALGAQAWLTGTDGAVFAGLGGAAQFFRVADATVTPAR